MVRETIKVAIADDNKEFSDILQECLNREPDIELVGVAYNGEQILSIIEEKMPDVIILDIIMPHLDGLGVLERLNLSNNTKRPKIIMLTAFGQETITQRVVELGADYYVLKPFNMDVLISRIRQLAGMISVTHPVTAAATMPVVKSRPIDVEVTLILIHLGGGISVGVQQNGKMIDVTNPNDLGPFSPERAGAVPSYGLLNLCFSGKYTIDEIKKKLIGNAGLMAHLGTSDGREVESRIASGDTKAALIYEAMAYQVAKEIGAMAAVVYGQVDGIVLTGGLAYSQMLVKMITGRVQFIGPVIVHPGEDELKALVEGALRVLRGEEQAKVYE